jgi:peptide/nickel transport system substrate-binding protein
LVSSGPYVISEYAKGSSITLTQNENYKGEHAAPANEIIIRYNEDPQAAVQALQNGEVSLISPQSTADILTALQGLESQGVTILSGEEATYEHVDLTFNNGGPFDPKTYGGDEEKALKVRQAFLYTIPRQTIVDNIIVPLNPNATIRNSYNVVPGSAGYDEVVAANGMSVYDTVDIEKAKTLLAEAGAEKPKVRILYGASNVRRQQEFKLIKESAEKAGFQIVDGGDDNWGAKLGDSKSYDASIFGWQTVGTAVTEAAANYVKGGTNNYGGINIPEIDQLYDDLQTELDPVKQQEINQKVEKILVDQAFGVTLYQFPAVTAYSSNVSGVAPITISPTIVSGFWNWKIEG